MFSLNKLTGLIYKANSITGDIKAVGSGKGKKIVKRAGGNKILFKGMMKTFNKIKF